LSATFQVRLSALAFFSEKEKRAQTIASILCAVILANNIHHLE